MIGSLFCPRRRSQKKGEGEKGERIKEEGEEKEKKRNAGRVNRFSNIKTYRKRKGKCINMYKKWLRKGRSKERKDKKRNKNGRKKGGKKERKKSETFLIMYGGQVDSDYNSFISFPFLLFTYLYF